MSYFFNDNSNQNEIYENEFFYNLGLEFPLSKKVYSYKNKVSYSKEKKIWFIRYKQDNNYIYLFGYNYGNDRQLDTKDPLLILKFNLFNAPNIGNGHFAVNNIGDEVRAVMNIQYKNYHSRHKSENLKSISPINIGQDNYLDLGNIRDSKELCENIEILLDEIESIFFFNRYLNRIKYNAPLKNDVEIKKQPSPAVEIKKDQDISSKDTKEEIIETPSEVILEHKEKIISCDFCDSEILDDNPFKICKACHIRISNYLGLLCGDFEINTEIPLENLLRKAQEHNLNRKDIGDITTTLNKYKYLHKINGTYQIYYNNELRNFIDKYMTKTENKNDNIENKVILVTEKIGLNTPFDITYLKEKLNFKNSEISRMIKYLDEKNAIVEDGEYYILVDKSNEINGINDNLMENDIKSENELTENNPPIEVNSVETSNEKTTIELKPIDTNNKTDIEIFYESYEKVLTYMENNVQIEEISTKLGIAENKLNIWIERGKKGQNPYSLLYDGIKRINEAPQSKINDYEWKKILKDIKAGFDVIEAAKRTNIPYRTLLFYLTKGKQGKENYKNYYEDYQNALKDHTCTQDEIKDNIRCKLCNEILSDESKVICDDCESKKSFAIDLKILIEKLKNHTQFTNENLIIYYNDDEIKKLINNLKQYDLVLEDTSMHIFYFKEENIETFLNTYFDANNSNYKSAKNTDSIKEKIKNKKIKLSKSQNIPYRFKGLNNDHTFLHRSGSSSKFTLEDVILIHKNYYEYFYSVDEIANEMGLNSLTIKKIIARFDEGDFDKYIEILENEKNKTQENISICKSCEKEFEPIKNEKYCKNCIIISRKTGTNKFKIILQTEPNILIGIVNDENFANEICSIGTNELSNKLNFEDVINNLKELIIYKKREEIRESLKGKEKTPKHIHQKSSIEYITKFKKSNENNSSKIKIITSMKKELINGTYSKLRFTGKLPNNNIDSSIMELLNEFKATKRELKLIPINENESKIIFHIITINSHTTKNMEILRKYGWQLKIKK